jgi:hypothetical protein
MPIVSCDNGMSLLCSTTTAAPWLRWRPPPTPPYSLLASLQLPEPSPPLPATPLGHTPCLRPAPAPHLLHHARTRQAAVVGAIEAVSAKFGASGSHGPCNPFPKEILASRRGWDLRQSAAWLYKRHTAPDWRACLLRR